MWKQLSYLRAPTILVFTSWASVCVDTDGSWATLVLKPGEQLAIQLLALLWTQSESQASSGYQELNFKDPSPLILRPWSKGCLGA